MPGVTTHSGSISPRGTTSSACTIVTFPAVAINGAKFRAVLL
jgi:hypothetical protein